MKISFFVKIIFLFTILAFAPIIIVSIIVRSDFDKINQVSTVALKTGTEKLVDESMSSLNKLGEDIIKNQALSTKKIVEQYLKNHPEKTSLDLINDPEFQTLAIQPVGKKGYTTVIQTKTQNIIAHPNKAMMGKELLGMKDKPEMKDWWKVVEVTWQNNIDNFGYYNWPEADGTYSKKYMYLAVIDQKLEGNIDLSVAATTYIKEFNAPVETLKEQIFAINQLMSDNILKATKDIQFKFYLILIVMIFIVLIFGFLFTSSITKPIKVLKKFSMGIASGNFNEPKIEIKSNDEFADLGNCFNKMADDLAVYKKDLEKTNQELENNNKELENRVALRTTELLKKNKELEAFNKMAVDRELAMIELKNKIKKLEDKFGKV